MVENSMTLNKKSDEIFLLEMLNRIIEKTEDSIIKPNAIGGGTPSFGSLTKLDSIAGFMFTRNILSNNDSIQKYEQLITHMLSLCYLKNDVANENFMVWRDSFYKKIEDNIANNDNPFFKKALTYFKGSVLEDTFKIEGYTYKFEEDICAVNPGDVVFDVGGYIGDTATYFSGRVGETGKVYVFEPVPSLIRIIEKTILDFNLQENVIPVMNGVGSKIETIRFREQRSMSIPDKQGNLEVQVTTIDKFIDENKISIVNFIKMDIEGGEIEALKGAENTIRTMSPKLAICIYHKVEHHWEVPQLILSFNENYKFFLNQNKLGDTETVLFALPTDNPCPIPAINENLLQSIINVFKSVHLTLSRRGNVALLKQVISNLQLLGENNLNWCFEGENKNILSAYFHFRLGGRYVVQIDNIGATIQIEFNNRKGFTKNQIEQMEYVINELSKKNVSFEKVTKANLCYIGRCLIIFSSEDDIGLLIAKVLHSLIRNTYDYLVNNGLALGIIND